MSVEDRIRHFCHDLPYASTKTQRKKIIDETKELIASESCKEFLNTDCSSLQVWPRLVENAIWLCQREIDSLLKKKSAPDVAPAELLCSIILRSGENFRPLVSVFPDLLRHLIDVLSASKATEKSFAKSYVSIMNHVFQLPGLCEYIDPALFSELVQFLISQLRESYSNIQPVECEKYSSALQNLTGNYGSDIHQHLSDIFIFASNWFRMIMSVSSYRDYEWELSSSYIYGTLTNLLKMYGTSCVPFLVSHGLCIVKYAAAAYRPTPRNDQMLLYLRAHLNVAMVAKAGNINDPIFTMLGKFVGIFFSTDNMAALSMQTISRGALDRFHMWNPPIAFEKYYLFLCADIMKIQLECSTEIHMNEQHRSKRAKVEDTWECMINVISNGHILCSRGINTPQLLPWLLVLASLLEGYPSDVSWFSSGVFNVREKCLIDQLVLSLNQILQISRDDNIKIVVISCLLRAAQLHYAPKFSEGALESWTEVLSTLLRSDLCYASSTALCAPGSFGEGVLGLLADIIRKHLVKATLISSMQDKLWKLPVFCSNMCSVSPVPFSLIIALINAMEISEDEDSISYHIIIGSVSPLDKFQESLIETRRGRLIFFALECFKSEFLKSKASAGFAESAQFRSISEIFEAIAALGIPKFKSNLPVLHLLSLDWVTLVSTAKENFGLAKKLGISRLDTNPHSDRHNSNAIRNLKSFDGYLAVGLRGIDLLPLDRMDLNHGNIFDPVSSKSDWNFGMVSVQDENAFQKAIWHYFGILLNSINDSTAVDGESLYVLIVQTSMLVQWLANLSWHALSCNMEESTRLLYRQGLWQAISILYSKMEMARVQLQFGALREALICLYFVVFKLVDVAEKDELQLDALRTTCRRCLEDWDSGKWDNIAPKNRKRTLQPDDDFDDDFLEILKDSTSATSQSSNSSKLTDVCACYCLHISMKTCRKEQLEDLLEFTIKLFKNLNEQDGFLLAASILSSTILEGYRMENLVLDAAYTLLRAAISRFSSNSNNIPPVWVCRYLRIISDVLGRISLNRPDYDIHIEKFAGLVYGGLDDQNLYSIDNFDMKKVLESSRHARKWHIRAASKLFDLCNSCCKDNFIKEVVKYGLNDIDLNVRLEAANALKVVFKGVMPEDHYRVFHEVYDNLPFLKSDDKEMWALKACTEISIHPSNENFKAFHNFFEKSHQEFFSTGLLALSCLTIGSLHVERHVLFSLLCLCCCETVFHQVRTTLVAVSQSLEYDGGMNEMITQNKFFLIYSWLDKFGTFDQFPASVMGLTVNSFIEEYASTSIPICILLQPKYAEFLLDLLSSSKYSGAIKNSSEVLKYFSPEIHALSWPLRKSTGLGSHVRQDVGMKVLEFMSSHLQKAEDRQMQDSQSQRFLLRLFDLRTVEPVGLYQHVTDSDIISALQDLADQYPISAHKTVNSFLPQMNLVEILLHLRNCMVSAHDVNREFRIYCAFDLVTKSLDWNLKPSIIGVCIQIFAWVIEKSANSTLNSNDNRWSVSQGTIPISTLQELYCHWLSSNEGRISAGPYFTMLVNALCIAFEDLSKIITSENHRLTTLKPWRDSICSLLSALLTKTPEDMDCFIRIVGYFPSHVEMSVVTRDLDNRLHRIDVPSSDILEKSIECLQKASVMGSNRNIMKSISSLRNMLQLNFGQFQDDEFQLAHQEKLVLTLLALCHTAKDAFVEEECMRVLGELGPFDMSNFSFRNSNTSSLWSLADFSNLAYDDPITARKILVLEMLSKLMLGRNHFLSKTAIFTIKSILYSPEGMELLRMYRGTNLVEVSDFFTFEDPGERPHEFNKSNSMLYYSLEKYKDVFSDSIWSTDGKSYEEWVCVLTSCLLRDCISDCRGNSTSITKNMQFLQSSVEICQCCPEIATFLFPIVVHDVLYRKFQQTGQYAGHSTKDLLSKYFSKYLLGTVTAEKQAVRLVINTLNFLQELQVEQYKLINRKSLKEWTSGKWILPWQDTNDSMLPFTHGLALDYMQVAGAAYRCDAPSSALLHMELAVDTKKNDEKMLNIDSRITKDMRQLLVQVYSSLMDHDSIHGITTGIGIGCELSDANYLLALGTDSNWQSLHSTFDNFVRSAAGPLNKSLGDNAQVGIATSLRQLGLDSTLFNYIYGSMQINQPNISNLLNHLNPEMKELMAESSWRLQSWDTSLFDDTDVNMLDEGCSQRLYKEDKPIWQNSLRINEHIDKLLRSCGNANINTFEYEMKKMQVENKNYLTVGLSSEGGAKLYSLLMHLQCATELEELRKFICTPGSDAAQKDELQSPTNLLQHWQKRLHSSDYDFEKNEKIMALREVMIRKLCTEKKSSIRAEAFECLEEYLRQITEAACTAGNVVSALSLVQRALQVSTYLQQRKCLNQFKIKMLHARVLWNSGNYVQAIAMGNLVISVANSLDHDDCIDHQNFLSDALLMVGEWIGKTGYENGKEVLKSYFEKAVGIAQNDPKLLANAHIQLAMHASTVYEKLKHRVNSNEWRDSESLIKKQEYELPEHDKKIKKASAGMPHSVAIQNEEYRKAYILKETTMKHINIDRKHRDTIRESMSSFLLQAIHNFQQAIITSVDQNSESIFRFISLWFENCNDERVNSTMIDFVVEVPSYKFLPLTYQIMARLGTSGNFQMVLTILIKRLCIEHPYHALLPLIALSRDESTLDSMSPRVNAAKEIIDELKNRDEISGLLRNLMTLTNAYIYLALKSSKEWNSQHDPQINFSSLTRDDLQSLPKCIDYIKEPLKLLPAMLTLPLRIDPSGCYKDIVRVRGFESYFKLTVSGVHRPKIVKCQGTDGIWYKQLVKGLDDIRQDAVMMQVFDRVNGFFQKTPDTEKRNLRIRTYCVVPLSPNSGVLEWVENTFPLRSFLREGKKSALLRYYPKDYSDMRCRQLLESAVKLDEKLKAWLNICDNTHPVFRFFFLETYTDPYIFFRQRQNYTRSVAVSSIVGHILGIGDRHTNNILMDEKTAEVIHIDFGITFEQGKVLPMPELVPFRLTRDMIDGMGITGTEGVFRKSCEASLQVMRDNSASLLMVLDVIVHDPMRKWTVSSTKAHRKQCDSQISQRYSMHEDNKYDNANRASAAERALLYIRQKLQGYEDFNVDAMSVAGQVKHLINEAQSAENLCTIYPGWGPWI